MQVHRSLAQSFPESLGSFMLDPWVLYPSSHTCWMLRRSVSPTRGPPTERFKTQSNGVYIPPCCILRFYTKSLEILLLSQEGNQLHSSVAIQWERTGLGTWSFVFAKSSRGFMLAIGFTWINQFYICFDKLFVHLKIITISLITASISYCSDVFSM